MHSVNTGSFKARWAIVLVVFLGFGFGLEARACSACVGAAENPVSPALQASIDAQREAAEKHEIRDYACPNWWQGKFPDLDVHTIENLVRFHELMVARASLGRRLEESLQLIRRSRATGGIDVDVQVPTTRAYRDAVFTLEKALQEHPALDVYKEEIEMLQEERRAVSAGQAEVLEAWHRERRERYALFNEAVQLAMRTYTDAMHALRARAGVGPGEALPEGLAAEAEALDTKRREALAFARESMQRVRDPEHVAQSRQEDGSQAVFDAANAQYAEVDAAQERIRTNMQAARERLRTADPEIRGLVAAKQEASRAHLASVASREDVQAAQSFVGNRDEVQAAIEQEARLLRRDILSLYPNKYPVLGELAKVGGLGHVPDSYWHF